MKMRSRALALTMVLLPALAAAQDDDLAPLPTLKTKTKPKVAPKTGVKRSAPTQTRVSAPRRGPAREDDLAPLVPVATEGTLAVRIASGLSGAMVSVDNKEVGRAPLESLQLGPGEHLVSVARPGYAVFVRKVTVTAGKTTELEAKLTAVAAVLAVTTDVPGAEVRADGRVVGTTPLEAVEVPPGTVTLVLAKAGYREHRQAVVVEAGRDYPLSIVLEPGQDRPLASNLTPGQSSSNSLAVSGTGGTVKPITQQWFFWVGVGVVVAAGIAAGTAIAMNSTREPLHRPQSQVCGPNGCDGCIGSCTPGIRWEPAP